MQEEWKSKYRAARVERNPALQTLRMEEAYEAIIGCAKEVEEISDERRKLDNAIDTLNLLRDLP